MKHQFGNFGGQYVPEVVVNALNQLEKYFVEAIEDPLFISKYKYYLKNYVGRPSSLYFAKNMTEDLKGAKVYLKREDLNHTGAHKINNCIGQILIALRMGKNKIIAETGAGQHGVATATAAAMFGMECEIFMGQEDIERQELNVYKMEMLGAKVTAVKTGTKTLSDAVDYAIGEWVKRIDDTFYLLGSAVGPHPYPTMVREFQKVIGQETHKQILEVEDKVDYAIACVGGGSNAIGLFYPLLNKGVKLIGVEGAGKGLDTDLHAATMAMGKKGIIHGMNTIYVQDSKGEVSPVYSISAGLDYPGVGPEHAYLKEIELAEYVSVTDKEAINAFKYLSKTEGIIPAIESSHAVAHALKIVPGLKETDVVIISISGRGDKDMDLVRSFK
ncbi:tryptophan synthase subunit beta [Mycoplasmatota bacterium]|nr:tryptophan synthase subunit beta [Mycoplasmatota bacterium]